MLLSFHYIPMCLVHITAQLYRLGCRYPPVAQSVEQLPFKERVAGSIPAGRTKISGANFCPTEKAALAAFVQESKRLSLSRGACEHDTKPIPSM